MDPEESSTLCETPFLVSSSAARGERERNEASGRRQLVSRLVLRALTQTPDEGHEFLVGAQRQDGALVRSHGRWEAEELQEG